MACEYERGIVERQNPWTAKVPESCEKMLAKACGKAETFTKVSELMQRGRVLNPQACVLNGDMELHKLPAQDILKVWWSSCRKLTKANSE